MNHRTLILPAAAALLSVAAAQQTGQPTAEMRARMAQMQPVLDLAQTVRQLPALEKNKATAMTKAQARALIPILTALQQGATVPPNTAKKYLTQIEDKILTERQLTAVDDLILKAEKEREARRAQGGSGQTRSGLRIPGVPGTVGGQRPAGATPGGAGGAQAGQFNPFTRGQGADELKKYLAALQRK